MDTEKHSDVVIIVQLFQIVTIIKREQVLCLALGPGMAPYILLFMVSLSPIFQSIPHLPHTYNYLSITLHPSLCPSR